MYAKACELVRNNVYGLIASSLRKEGDTVNMSFGNATGFMVSPGYIITAGHFVHVDKDFSKPIHNFFEIIKASNIGGQTQVAEFVAEDSVLDIAVLKGPEISEEKLLIKDGIMPRGTSCGFLGFPLSNVEVNPDGKKQFHLRERFQGGFISNFSKEERSPGKIYGYYETDGLMYEGSSGCPCFNTEGEIIGMQIASQMRKKKDGEGIDQVSLSLSISSPEIIKFLKDQSIPF